MAKDYSTLVTSEHQKPKFLALVGLLTGAIGQITDVTASISDAFDLDNAVGAQLDIDGQWIGQDRNVANVLTVAFFGFSDNSAALTFGEENDLSIGGRFYEEGEAFENVTVLGDPEYKTILRAKILKNQYNGLTSGLEETLDSLLSPIGLFNSFVGVNATINDRTFTTTAGFPGGVWAGGVHSTDGHSACRISTVVGSAGSSAMYIGLNTAAALNLGGDPDFENVPYALYFWGDANIYEAVASGTVLASIPAGVAGDKGTLIYDGTFVYFFINDMQIAKIAVGTPGELLYFNWASFYAGAMSTVDDSLAYQITDNNNLTVTINIPAKRVTSVDRTLFSNLDLLPRPMSVAYTVNYV